MDVGQVYSLGKIYACIKGNYCICVSLLEILLIVPHQVRWEDQYIILVGVSSSHCDLFRRKLFIGVYVPEIKCLAHVALKLAKLKVWTNYF